MSTYVGSNTILQNLTGSDFQLIEPHLEACDLPVREQLERQGRKVKSIYFLEKGIASVVADGERPLEIGVIGREGMTGTELILGGEASADHDTFMQVAGSGYRVSAAEIKNAICMSTPLHRVMLRFVLTFFNQVTQTSIARGRAKIEHQLARWLLLANDRLDNAIIPLTQEFIGIMLGIQRPAATVALQGLERSGAIRQRRGTIEILSRTTLEQIAKDIYVKPVRSQRRT
jgi:CRP-like cAMP-binding protein